MFKLKRFFMAFSLKKGLNYTYEQVMDEHPIFHRSYISKMIRRNGQAVEYCRKDGVWFEYGEQPYPNTDYLSKAEHQLLHIEGEILDRVATRDFKRYLNFS